MNGELPASQCVFQAPDKSETAAYCRDMPGFRRVDSLEAREKHICLQRDCVEFILTRSNGQRVIPSHELYGFGGGAYVIVKDRQALQEEYQAKGGRIIQRCTKQTAGIRSLLSKIWTGAGFISASRKEGNDEKVV